MFTVPAFGENQFTDIKSNETTRVVLIQNVTAEHFDKYVKLFADNGFENKEETARDFQRFAAYGKDGTGVFLNYFRNTAELSIVIEENTNYFNYTDKCTDFVCTPQITHPKLENYGMSEIIRTSDGRFIIFDGGRQLAPDADTIFNTLKAGSPCETPIIAAWIMTHPHGDHYSCFVNFYERYKEQVRIEKFFYNFPATDDYGHYPALKNVTKHNPTLLNETEKMLEFYGLVKDSGAQTYIAQTGQTYRIGDAVCTVLATITDTIHVSSNLNATSLVIRMELGSQVILWTGDASFGDARLPERYGKYLESDILQVPHHGFKSGTASAQIEAYDLIKPQTVLLPAHDYYTYGTFCIFMDGFNHLIRNGGAKELINGEKTRVLNLPYTPVPYGAKEMQEKYEAGWKNAGSCSWVFMGLNTAKKSDFEFTFLNSTNAQIDIEIELFFEDPNRNIRRIKTSVKRNSIRTISILDPEQTDSDSFYFNPWGLKYRPVPKRAPFGVRFYSDKPIVIQHKKHKAAYHG